MINDMRSLQAGHYVARSLQDLKLRVATKPIQTSSETQSRKVPLFLVDAVCVSLESQRIRLL